MNHTDDVLSLEALPANPNAELEIPEEKADVVEAAEELAPAPVEQLENEQTVPAEVAVISETDPLSIELSLPEGYSSTESSNADGTIISVSGGRGTLEIFISNQEASNNAETDFLGSGGLFELRGWSPIETTRSTQPAPGWATSTFPFVGGNGNEGVLLVGQRGGRQVRIELSAPTEELDQHFEDTKATVESLSLSPTVSP